MAVQLVDECTPLDERVAAAARLLEDMAQTCAVLRVSCFEQAQLLRGLSSNHHVLERVLRVERTLGITPVHMQGVAPVRRLADGV